MAKKKSVIKKFKVAKDSSKENMVDKEFVQKNIKKVEKTKKNPASAKIIKEKLPKIPAKNIPSLKLTTDTDIALDFATKTYKRFNQAVKAIILFGSTAKKTAVVGSDIDLIILIDDVSIKWTQELIAWYREELDKILMQNPYKKSLHINTVKLSTWWDDLLKGDPVVINILRYGQAVLDFAGFFNPLKFLLLNGKIRSTPEAVYNCLERAPTHILRSKVAELNTIEGLYWSMVDSAHAALIAMNILPPSPEHIAANLEDIFVMKGKLNKKYVDWFQNLMVLHKKIAHGEITDLRGVEIDMWQDRAEDFMRTMANIVQEIIQ